MSWLSGYIGTPSRNIRNRLVQLHGKPRFTHRERGLYLAAGGMTTETCLSNLPDQNREYNRTQDGWIVCGMGIDPDRRSVMDTGAWNRLINRADDTRPLKQLDGHFVLLQWSSGRVVVRNDVLGLRSCYFHPVDGGYIFSTRLDWIAKAAGGARLDLNAFGSHWLGFNQMNRDCLLKAARRLGQGGMATLRPDSLNIREEPFDPFSNGNGPLEKTSSQSIMHSIIQPALSSGHTISLGLSGGLDSRVLLAQLLSEDARAQLHLFGSRDDPDVQIPHRIAHDTGLNLQFFEQHVDTTTEQLVDDLLTYSARSFAQTPASHTAKMQYYDQLRENEHMMIDGGFGEIARRQFFNRLVVQNLLPGRTLRPGQIAAACQWPRPDFFNGDVWGAMQAGLRQSAEALLRELPPPDQIGMANFADLIALRTRLPNTYGREQARLDDRLLNYMPFAQPSFIRQVLQFPVAQRIRARLFYKVIAESTISLQRYPLVKNGTTYPFNLPSPLAPYYTLLKKKWFDSYTNTFRHTYLHKLKSYIRDTAHSHYVQNCNFYDHKKLQTNVENYFDGHEELASRVDWWLSFETWRHQWAIND